MNVTEQQEYAAKNVFTTDWTTTSEEYFTWVLARMEIQVNSMKTISQILCDFMRTHTKKKGVSVTPSDEWSSTL